jgi:hypothetical protein
VYQQATIATDAFGYDRLVAVTDTVAHAAAANNPVGAGAP